MLKVMKNIWKKINKSIEEYYEMHEEGYFQYNFVTGEQEFIYLPKMKKDGNRRQDR